MSVRKTSINAFYSILEKHDWFYSYADDHRSWKKGQESYKKIAEIKKQSKGHRLLYDDFSSHIHEGALKPFAEDGKYHEA